jgi:hypothetical protein
MAEYVGHHRQFPCRLDSMRAIISADRLTAVGVAVFDSTGYSEDGTTYNRPERSTVVLGRTAIGEDWVALHTHFPSSGTCQRPPSVTSRRRSPEHEDSSAF